MFGCLRRVGDFPSDVTRVIDVLFGLTDVGGLPDHMQMPSALHLHVPKCLHKTSCMILTRDHFHSHLTYVPGLAIVNRLDVARRFAQ